MHVTNSSGKLQDQISKRVTADFVQLPRTAATRKSVLSSSRYVLPFRCPTPSRGELALDSFEVILDQRCKLRTQRLELRLNMLEVVIGKLVQSHEARPCTVDAA
jgi:hypothetical protein